MAKDGLNPKFVKYVEGFKEVFIKRFGREPVMGDYVSNGWLNIANNKLVDFYECGKRHAENIKE